MKEKMISSIETTVTELLNTFLQTEGYELVDVETAGRNRNKTLRLLIHKDEGLTVSDCKYLDQAVRPILEAHQLLTEFKQLEIASPGLDRPLKTEADFKRNLGRNVQIQITAKNGQIDKVEGIITDVVDRHVVLEEITGQTVHIKTSEIYKGHIQLVW